MTRDIVIFVTYTMNNEIKQFVVPLIVVSTFVILAKILLEKLVLL